MLAITCEKCRRRYTATDEELRVYLQQAEGKKHAQVLCPHCGKPSKVASDRIQQALRFSVAAEEGSAAGAAQSEGSQGSVGQSGFASGVTPGGPGSNEGTSTLVE